jgi:hypothetical protein
VRNEGDEQKSQSVDLSRFEVVGESWWCTWRVQRCFLCVNLSLSLSEHQLSVRRVSVRGGIDF